MEHDIGGGIAFRVAVAADMVALVPNFDTAAQLLDKLPGDDCTGKSGSYHQDGVL